VPTTEDIQFSASALRRRLVSQHQVHKAIRALEDYERLGTPRAMSEVMVARGYIGAAEREDILAELGLRLATCGVCRAEWFVQAEPGPRSSACPFCDAAADAPARSGVPKTDRVLIAGEGEDRLAGREIPPYRFLERIGGGGMAAVYRGEHMSARRVVALKVLLPELRELDERFVARFLREGRAAAALQHPNIVTVYDAGALADAPFVEGDLYFIEMEFVDGYALRPVMERLGRLAPGEAAALAIPVLRALAFAHQQNIVHRDIKPDNIMITRHGQVKVADFGVAKDLSDTSTFTRPGVVMGTPWYMAPEQSAGQPVDGRADIYSLGVTLYHGLAGRPPFEIADTMALLKIRQTEPVPDLHRQDPSIPRKLSAAVRRMTEIDRDDRYATAEHAIVDLEALTRAVPACRGSLRSMIRRFERRRRPGKAQSGPNAAAVPNPAKTPSLVQRLARDTKPSPLEAAEPPRSGDHTRWFWIAGAIIGIGVLAALIVLAMQ